ncbi:hypothetical protein CUMW_224320 [Citrus unshiu]|uniref:NB-ARC domain-containing protein n=2 Tax=Citrus TaxID=2706 RepID=A0A2H5QF68_CITUN|nr:hypothetical protein CUMW_224320 [Citrus unshiu]
MASVGDIWNVVKDCFLCSFYLYSNSRDLKDKVDTLSVKKGMESILDEVWECFEDDFPMRIICLYGVSGVGKTTLLVNFNSKFSDTRHNFYLVILVKAVDNKNQQGRAEEIFQRLSQRRFALLLDDLRGPINLDEAGVPDQNGSKIVFTTIMEDACNTMGDQIKFKVDYLRRDDDVLNFHPDILELAETVADLCRGLPLAHITIGRAMANTRNRMGDLILPRLKFSYDHLSTETHKTCFSFCSLFLKNQLIRKDELVDLWIGEGLFRGSHNIVVARMQGKCIIDSLIGVCLLEEVQTSFGNYVKMHDLLRDLALWIASQDEGNKILASKPKNDELIIERQSIT